MKLHTFSASLALGLFWGVSLLGWTFITMQNGWGSEVLDLIATVYPGYEVSIQGAFVGLLWGFVDAFVGTYIVVWLYNLFVAKLGKKKK